MKVLCWLCSPASSDDDTDVEDDFPSDFFLFVGVGVGAEAPATNVVVIDGYKAFLMVSIRESAVVESLSFGFDLD
jgi:hypothetical protein